MSVGIQMKHLICLISILFICLLHGDAKPKKTQQAFTPWSYTEQGFYAYRDTFDEALITSDSPDGIHAPLPFRVIRGELSDFEFRETLIFIVDNLSEAYYH